jgi:hypothetical protein
MNLISLALYFSSTISERHIRRTAPDFSDFLRAGAPVESHFL